MNMIRLRERSQENTIDFSTTPRLSPIARAARMAVSTIALASIINPLYAQVATQAGQAPQKTSPELPAVTVTAERQDGFIQTNPGGQTARGGRLGLLGNTDAMSAPFHITSYTSQMIANQQAKTAADVLANDPSVRWTGQTGGILDAFFVRGFAIGEGNLGEVAFDGQYGIAPNYRILSDYAERIEVIKGPGALLYGMSPNSGVGGVINIVPKRAMAKDLSRVTVDYASDSQLGARADLSRRFGTERQFGVRINTSHSQGDAPVDKQSRKATVGAVALDYQTERFRASLDLLSQQEHFDAPSRPFLAAAGIAIPSAPNGQRNVTQSWEWAKIEDRSALLKAEFDLNENMTLFASAGSGTTDVARVFGTPTILNAAGDTSSRPDYFKFEIDRSSYDAGLRAQLKTGAVRHTITLQASGYRDQLNRGSTTGTAVTSNIYAPTSRAAQNIVAPASVPKISETDLSGFALADTMAILDNRLNVTLGARHQQIKSDNFSPTTGAVTSSYDKNAITPLVGVVYKPSNNISFYGNYIEGLSRGDIAPPTASNAGQVFAPYKAKQQELGVKFDFGRLHTTVSVFQITKPSGQLTGTVFAVDAEQRNRGFEVAVAGEVNKNIRILGGLSLIDAELTKTNSAATRGKDPVGVPSIQANLGGEWDLPWTAGLTLTGKLAYAGKQYVNQTNTQAIPSFTRVDLGTRYVTKVAGKGTTFRANVLNAFDRDYWSGVASYGGFVQGAPRTFMLSATIDF